MKLTRVHVGGIIAVLSLGLCAASWATPAINTSFKTMYGVKVGSNLDKAKCSLCHGATVKTTNPFGADMTKAMKDANVTALSKDIMAKIETLDSDKDGVANIEEITADTLPGDAASKPAEWAVPTVAAITTPDAVPAALATANYRDIVSGGTAFGEFRMAVSDTNLAIDVKVMDPKITPATKAWSNTGVAIAVSAPGMKTINRLAISPSAADAAVVQFCRDGVEQPLDGVQWKLIPGKDSGYEVVALVPLSMLQIDPAKGGFTVEVAVANGAGSNLTYFGTAPELSDNAKFGTVKILPTK